LIVGLVSFLMVIAGVWWWWRQPGKKTEGPTEEYEPVGMSELFQTEREGLLQAIASLDDAYQEGEVDEADYRRRRGELKEGLVDLIQREGK
jgi:hypothetical protein